jgi:hypothetical protein
VKEKMNFTIVYDNKIFTKGIGLRSDCGFARLIELAYDTILLALAQMATNLSKEKNLIINTSFPP